PLVAFLLAASPDTSPAASAETAPDVEEGLVPNDVSEVWNPAFPARPVPATPPGPARKRVELSLLDPAFTGELAAPRAEFQGWRPPGRSRGGGGTGTRCGCCGGRRTRRRFAPSGRWLSSGCGPPRRPPPSSRRSSPSCRPSLIAVSSRRLWRARISASSTPPD